MKFVCSVCGYVYEGDAAPAVCPVCGVGADKFTAMSAERVWADEHKVGVAQGLDPEVVEGLRANFAYVPRHGTCGASRGLPRDRSLLGKSRL